MKQVAINNDFIFSFIKKIAIDNFLLLLPLFSIIFVAVLISPILFGGWSFSMGSVHFKPDKLDPIKNLMNLFSPKRMLLEMSKSFLKALFILGVLVIFFIINTNEILTLVHSSYIIAIGRCYNMVINFVSLLLFTIVILVCIDAIIHYFQFQNQSKMTTQELKDEMKESEGSADVKRKIRSAQMRLIKQRVSLAVPKANVIVTNPTHYAIALRYEESKDHAPKVVAKGKDEIAKQIRMIAIANGIPLYEAPTLARAIYHTTKVGLEIHPALYMAVAIVLSYVHQLKHYQMGLGQTPVQISQLDIPKEFIYDE